MSVFISYAREDRDYVDHLFAKLQQNKIKAWYDRELERQIGVSYLDVIDGELKKSQAILLVLSLDSIHASGVHKEVLKAQSLGKRILPILIGDLKERDIPHWIIDKQYADGRNNKDPFPKILRSLTNAPVVPSNFSQNQSRRIPSGSLSDLNATLIIVPDGGHINNDRIGINSRQIGHNQVGIITSFPGDLDSVRRVQFPVRLTPLDIVPENSVVISKGLQDELGLYATSTDTWELEFQGLQLAPVQYLNLELTIETSLEDAVNELEHSRDLAGRLIWTGTEVDEAAYKAILLEISGRPYRIAQLEPIPVNTKIVLEIVASTNLNIFSSSAKSGVDMVILADCSGSMGIADLTDTSDQTLQKGWFRSRKQQTLSRMKALQRSLTKLLEMRLRISGRVSRVALVAFTRESKVRFPRHGNGMSEIDGSSLPALIKDFKDAIGLLKAEQAGTDIGQALHYSAELLHKHGHPNNERLVVLISDGADWQPKGSDATGEVLSGLEDPVSLMDHLHETMEIHLHVIGISNKTLFDKWMSINNPGKEAHISMIPNHDLLHRLVSVGGNDPSRTGDTDVLEEYFSGLGQGVTRKVICPKSSSPPSLQAREKEIILASNQRIRSEQVLSRFRVERNQLVDVIYERYISVNEHAIAIAGEALLTPSSSIQSISVQFSSDIIDAKACQEFTESLLELVFNAVPRHSNDFEIPDALKLLSSTFTKDVRYIVRQFNQYFRSTNQSNTPVQLGQFATQLLGNSTIEYDDVEAWSKIQLYCLKETAKILQQVRTLLFDALVEAEQVVADDEDNKPQFRFIG